MIRPINIHMCINQNVGFLFGDRGCTHESINFVRFYISADDEYEDYRLLESDTI